LLFAEKEFELCATQPDGATLRQHYEIVWKSTGKKPEELISKMYEIISHNELVKLNELFPDFEILPEPENKKVCILEECILKLKSVNIEEKNKKEHTKIIFDIHTPKLKKWNTSVL